MEACTDVHRSKNSHPKKKPQQNQHKKAQHFASRFKEKMHYLFLPNNGLKRSQHMLSEHSKQLEKSGQGPNKY